MEKLNRDSVEHIRIVINNALTEVGKELDMNLNLGNITYDEDGFHTKLTGRNVGAKPKTMVDYENISAHDEDMPPIDSVILLAGNQYSVSGWKRSARKNKILITDMGGKDFVISYDQLINAEVLK